MKVQDVVQFVVTAASHSNSEICLLHPVTAWIERVALYQQGTARFVKLLEACTWPEVQVQTIVNGAPAVCDLKDFILTSFSPEDEVLYVAQSSLWTLSQTPYGLCEAIWHVITEQPLPARFVCSFGGADTLEEVKALTFGYRLRDVQVFDTKELKLFKMTM